jgi:hypothetical protein
VNLSLKKRLEDKKSDRVGKFTSGMQEFAKSILKNPWGIVMQWTKVS